MGELVKRLREAANGLGTLKTERGDYGLCDEAADRIEALEAELHALTCGGTCEVAARNPNVMSYMEHWESRAEKAEAENALREAFWAKTVIQDGCWKWVGSTNKRDGRGMHWDGVKNIVAPRLSWFVFHGEWPSPDLFVCHSCDNPNCVNPSHLWLGTVKDNATDASKKGRLFGQSKTECKRGHPLVGDNVFYTSQGRRSCRACQRQHNKKHQMTDAAREKRRLAQIRRRAAQEDKA